MVYQKDTAKQAASEARRPGTSRVSTTQQNSERQAKQAASLSGGSVAPPPRPPREARRPGTSRVTTTQQAASTRPLADNFCEIACAQVVFYKERTREHTPVCDRRE